MSKKRKFEVRIDHYVDYDDTPGRRPDQINHWSRGETRIIKAKSYKKAIKKIVLKFIGRPAYCNWSEFRAVIKKQGDPYSRMYTGVWEQCSRVLELDLTAAAETQQETE